MAVQVTENNRGVKWLVYGLAWLSLALTLSMALNLALSLLSLELQIHVRVKLQPIFHFSAIPFAIVRIVIWLADKKVSLPRSFDGMCYVFIEFFCMVALVALSASLLAGPFPYFFFGIPIAFICAVLMAIGMAWSELADWYQRVKRTAS